VIMFDAYYFTLGLLWVSSIGILTVAGIVYEVKGNGGASRVLTAFVLFTFATISLTAYVTGTYHPDRSACEQLLRTQAK